MEEVREFLEELMKRGVAKGHFLGLLHILIGRRIARSEGAVVSVGLTWRDVSVLLKNVRWDPDAVRDVGIDPDTLPPRDRQRYWYSAIAQAQVGSTAAVADANKLIPLISRLGYTIGPAPGSSP